MSSWCLAEKIKSWQNQPKTHGQNQAKITAYRIYKRSTETWAGKHRERLGRGREEGTNLSSSLFLFLSFFRFSPPAVSVYLFAFYFVTLGTRGFSRVQREFSVLAEGRHIFGRRPKPRAGHYKDLTENGNRARKVSGTQGIILSTLNYINQFTSSCLCRR